MNEQPTPYEHPGRRSNIRLVPPAPPQAVTLSPLIDGMVTGTLGRVPLTSDVYEQIPWSQGICDEPLARVRFDDGDEVLGLEGDRVVRDLSEHPEAENLPQLILTDGAR